MAQGTVFFYSVLYVDTHFVIWISVVVILMYFYMLLKINRL